MVAVYYTIDGSTPNGTKGVGNVGTLVVAGSFSCTFGGGPLIDVWTATIPAQPAGTVVKYKIGAWLAAGGDEIFANSGTCGGCGNFNNSTLATTFDYTVASTTDLYWDSNGATAGAGGATPAGNWGVSTFWSSVFDGTGATGAWDSTKRAVFSAGTDASGAFIVTVNGTQNATGISVEEGAVQLATGAAAVGAGNVTVNTGATLATDSSLRLTATAGATLNLNGSTLRCLNPSAAGTFIDTDFVITLGPLGGIFSYTVPNILNIVQTASVLQGPGSLTKTGVGVLAFANACTYSGPTLITDGEVRIRTTPDRLPIGTALTVTAPGILNLNNVGQRIGSLSGNGSVGLGGATLIVGDSSDTVFTGSISNVANAGAGGVTTGSGSVTKTGTGTLTLAGSNWFTGTLTVSNGTLFAPPNSQLCDPICDVNVHGGSLNLSNTTQTILRLAGSNGVVNLGTGHTLKINQSSERNFFGVIAGDGSIIKSNSGTLGLFGNNTYEGSTMILTGAIRAASATALGGVSSGTEVASGGTLLFDGAASAFSIAEPVSIAGIGAGTFGSAIFIQNGANVTVSGPVTLSGNAAVGVSGAGTGAYSNPNSFTGVDKNLTLIGGSGAGGGGTISGTISLGTGSLFKLQGGAWTLSAPAGNTYSGGTVVSNGTLRIANSTGSATGSGDVTLYGGTISGPGSIAGALVLNGTISPGASPGTMNTGSETWNGGASYTWEINDVDAGTGADPGWDLINITGGLTITATPLSKFNLNITSLALANTNDFVHDFTNASDYTWTILKTTTGITGFDAAAFNISSVNFSNALGDGLFTIALANGGNDLVLNFVRKPGFAVQPADTTAECGGPFMLSVSATGTAPLSYQWKHAGTNLPGATSATLAGTATPLTAGAYEVEVSNTYGTTNSAVATLTIQDTTAPTITCGQNETLNCGLSWDFTVPTVNDVCDPSPVVTIESTATNTTCGDMFVATRVWRVTDSSANFMLCTQVVTTVDNVAPMVTCAPNQTINCNAPWNFTPPTANDACHTDSGDVTIAIVSTTTNNFVGGYTASRTWSAIDPCGNSNGCVQTVTVNLDTVGPVLTACPANIALIDAGNDGEVATWTDPTAMDDCDGATTVVCDPASGSTFSSGTTTVVCSSVDSASNSNGCSFSVTVCSGTPSTVWVDDGYTNVANGTVVTFPHMSGGASHIVGCDAFGTIQAGINAVSSGGTVIVAAGDYHEDVAVNKVVTVSGANRQSVVYGVPGGDGATFRISSSGSVVEGFTITREGNNVTDWNNPNLNSAGVAMQGLTVSATIRSNLITGNRTGIDINNSGGSTIQNNAITFNRTGVILRNQTDGLTVTENEITDNWTGGFVFLDASGGSNVPVQQAANSNFRGNNISGNWYGGIVDRQSGGSLPAPGSNLKNFSANWLGTVTPVVTTLNSAEPGYAAQIPVAYGGTATNPGGAPDIAGPASANIDYTPLLVSGTDIAPGTYGFQGDFTTVRVVAASPQVTPPGKIQEGADTVSGSTVVIEPGAYSENIVITENVVLDGAGSGSNPAVDTIITAANAGQAVIAINDASGTMSERLTIQDLRVTGGTDGVQVNSTTGAQSFYRFDNVASVNNSGNGISFAGTTDISDVQVNNAVLNNNGNSGIRAASSLPLFNLVSVTGGEIRDNAVIGFSVNPSGLSSHNSDNITIDGTVFSNNGVPSTTGSGDLSFFGFNGNASLKNLSITSDGFLPVQFRGKGTAPSGTWSAAGTVLLQNVTISGTGARPGLYIVRYTDVAGFSFDNVNLSSYVPPSLPSGFASAMQVEHVGATPMALNKLTLPCNATPSGYGSLVMLASGGAVANCNTVIVGANTPSEMETCVFDQQDNPALGDIVFPTFTVTCAAPNVSACDAGMGGANVTYGSPTVTADCGPTMVNCTPASGSFFPNGMTTVTCIATDARGASNSCTFTVTVNALPNVSVNSPTICAGGSAMLTATTDADSPSYLWSPGGQTTQSITVSPGSTTTYTVTVTDGTTGCSNSASGTVTVNPLPVVSVNSGTLCGAGSVTLTATHNAASPSYLWSPGGETTQSITVSPTTTTTYSVLVTDGNTGCTNSASGTVTVRGYDLASNTSLVTVNDNSTATPYPSVINVSGLTAVVCRVQVTLSNINHSFPDDLDIILVGPNGQGTLLMSDVGAHFPLNNVTLTLDDQASSSLPDGSQITSGAYKPTNILGKEDGNQYIDNFPPPAPQTRFPTNLAVFNGINPNGAWSLYVVDDEVFDAGTLLNGWSLSISTSDPIGDVGVAQADLPDPVAVGSNLTYTITVTNAGPATANGVTLSDTLPGSVTFVSANGSQGSCAHSMGIVSCTLGAINASSSATVTIVVTPTATGTIVNSATVATTSVDFNSANNSSSASTLVRNPPVITVGPQDLTVCVDKTAMFSVTATGDAPLSYQWYYNGNPLSGETSTTLTISGVQLSHAGTYSVVVANDVGATTDSATLTVNPLPMVSINPATICNGQSTNLTATTDAASPSYLWSPGGQTTQTITVNPTTTTTYSVLVTDGVTGCTNSASVTVIVNQLATATPLISITNACPGGSVSFTTTAGGTGPFTYVWRKDGMALGETSSTLTLSGLSASDTATYCVEVTGAGACNTVTNCATLSVVTNAPIISAQPQNQTVPMGNNATFSVTASSLPNVTTFYQWLVGGSPISGATASSYTANNVILAQSGEQYSVIVSNCAGSVTSSVAVLTVTPVFGISFDFNTPGQFTNVSYNIQNNDWLHAVNDAANPPPQVFETTTGGVSGSGAIDPQIRDLTIINAANSYDFSLNGKTIVASTMIRVVAPTANGRQSQLGFVSQTNVYAGTIPGVTGVGINDNNPQGFMTVILQSTNQPALGYELRVQTRPTNGPTAEILNISPTSGAILTAGTWYKLVATFANISGTAANTMAVSGSLQDMGASGTTPGAVVASFAPTNVVSPTLVSQKNMFLAMRTATSATGVDLWDNIYAHSTAGAVFFVQAPLSQTVAQNKTVTFRALVDGDGPYTYQWNKNGSPISGARNWKYTIPPAATGDNGAQYTVTVTGPANTITSSPATLTVTPDALAVASVGSVDGCTVGVRFNGAVDPVTAVNPANYLINGSPAVAARLSLSSADSSGRNVIVTPASDVAGNFTVTVNGVLDFNGAAMGAGNTGNGMVEGLIGFDINPGVIIRTGSAYSFAPGQIEMTGSGIDIFTAPDSFRFQYEMVTGDFDIKARIPYQDFTRASAKVGFQARISLDPNAPQVTAAVNPKWPGRGFYEGTHRQAWGGGGNSWGNSGTRVNYPDSWLRFRRAGNTFLRYSSTDGVNWTAEGQITPTILFPDTILVGLEIVSAANGMPNTGVFESYGDFVYPGTPVIAITTQPEASVTVAAGSSSNLAVTATLSGAPASELVYIWQRSNGSGGFTNIPSAVTTNRIFNTGNLFGGDNGAQYRVIVKAPGAADVISTVTTVSVTDATVPTVTASSIPAGANAQIVIVYSEPMGASAASTANYVITNSAGANIGLASASFLGSDLRTVILNTSVQLGAGNYFVVINNVRDQNNNALAANTLRTVSQALTAPVSGPIVVDFFGGLGAVGGIGDLIVSPKHTFNTPDFTTYSNLFGINSGIAAFPNTLDQYGGKIWSYFVPPTNGAYKFFIRGDDFVEFFMNTNSVGSTNPPDRTFPVTVGGAFPQFSSPVAEYQYKAFDNNVNTKYLNTNKVNTGVIILPSRGGTVVTGVRFTSANDAPDRDPMTWTLEGSATSTSTNGPWTAISSGNTGIGSNRLTQATAVTFANATSYRSYRLVFPTIRDSGVAIGMQVAEIELLDASGNDVTLMPMQLQLTANNANYAVANSVTNTLVAGQRYYTELRFKESTGGDGGTLQVRNDNTLPAATEVAPASLFAFPSDLAPATPVVAEYYTGLVTTGQPYGTAPQANGNFADLIDATNNSVAFLARVPNIIGFERTFAYSSNLVHSSVDNALGRIYAYYTPPATGLYRAWVRADDSWVFYMNTNSNPALSTSPAGKSEIAFLDRFVNGNYRLAAENIPLNAGQRYFMEGIWREGGSGDGMAVVFRAQADTGIPPTTEVMPPGQLSFPFDVDRLGAVKIAGVSPINPTVVDGQQLILIANGISGALPYSITWLKNGQPIAVNNSLSFTTLPLGAADNGAVFTAVVSNLFSRAEASTTVTVLSDSTAPTVVQAIGSQYYNMVGVTFSELLDPESAMCVANYRINNGVTVLNAVLDPTRRKVSLATTPMNSTTVYTLTVNNVRDASSAGNLIAPNTMVNFSWIPGGCGVYVELFTNVAGTAVANLQADPKYILNLPDVAFYNNRFFHGPLSWPSLTDVGMNNYGSRVSGLFMPTNTGNYRFYIRGDDGTQLFMNTNGPDASGRVLVARSDGANANFDAGTGGSISPVISLTQGTLYYMEALHKEGGGGDYMQIAMRPVDGSGNPVPAPGFPAVPAINVQQELLHAGMFTTWGNMGVNSLVVVQPPPADVSVKEHDLVNLSLLANVAPVAIQNAVCFQWQKFDVGSLTFKNIPGAVTSNLTFSATAADSELEYRVTLTMPGTNVTYTTIIHVLPDDVGPSIVSASSLDGRNISVCFSEPVDSNTVDRFTFSVNDAAPGDGISTASVWSADGTKVMVTMDAPLTPPTFKVQALFINDTVGNPGFSDTVGRVRDFITMSVGPLATIGSSFSCEEDEIDVIAGGSDIWGNSDQGHLTLSPRYGDFDIWVRVNSLRAVSTPISVAKAGLMARQYTNADSRTLHVLVNPPLSQGGRDQAEPAVRFNNAAATADMRASFDRYAQAGIPNAWVRMKRSGDNYTVFRSYDGINWTPGPTVPFNLSDPVLIGLATAPNNNGGPPTYAEYRDIHIPNIPIILSGPTPPAQTVPLGGTATISVVASNGPNSGPLVYQWKKEGVSIPGANGPTLIINNVQSANVGTYTVWVGNDGGNAISGPATVNTPVGAPIATNDSLTVTQNVARSVSAASLLANDSDPNGDTLSLIGVSGLYPTNYIVDFNAGLPADGSAIYGSANHKPSGGDNNTGYLEINPKGNGLLGAFVTPELTGERSVSAFNAAFKLRIAEGSAQQADGFSFNVGPDLTLGTSGTAENGVGSGLSFCVDNYQFAPYPVGGQANTSGLKVRYKGLDIAGVRTTTWDQNRFVPVNVSVTAQGLLTVLVDGTNVFGNISLPWVPARARAGFYARTGSENEAHAIDELSITTITTVETARPRSTTFSVFGSGRIEGGVLHVTDPANNLQGSYVTPVINTDPLVSLQADFKIRIGGGTSRDGIGGGADGFSFSLGPDLPNATWGEEGAGTYLNVCFDTWDNGTTDTAPAIDVKYGGTGDANIVASKSLGGRREAGRAPATPLLTDDSSQVVNLATDGPGAVTQTFAPVSLKVDSDGTLDLSYKGVIVFTNIPVPGFTGLANLKLGFGGRTGNANDAHWVDDLNVTMTTTGSPATYGETFSSSGFATVVLSNGVVTYTPPPNTCGPDTYYYLVSDGVNTSVGQVDVNIVESTPIPPSITQCATNRTIGAQANCEVALPNLTSEVRALDNCCCVTITQSPVAGTMLGLGTHTITFTATDTIGLTATCQATVTVVDTNAPVITCPLDIIAECTNGAGTSVEFTVPATDNCTLTLNVVCTPPSGTAFPLGTNLVSCSVTDGAGNSASCGFNVIVRDTTAPVVTCPANITTLCTSTNGATVTYSASATDSCQSASPVCTPPSGSTFPFGTTMVNCSATDPSGNTGNCSFTVTVTGNVRPTMTITPAGLNVTMCWMETCAPFILEESTDLVTWTNSAAVITLNSGQYCTTVPAIGNKFYRLRQQ